MHTLVFVNPGHFHAALVLRETHPALSDDIYVYSDGGPELDRFLEIAESYNTRQARPTHWTPHVYRGPDYLEKAIEQKKGDIGILAGKNHTKMAQINALSAAGFAILADKPWVTTREALSLLNSTLAPDRELAMDIMTERHEITTTLQQAFACEEAVLGEVRVEKDGSPSVFMESVHHLYKVVNKKPLVRPEWYFDIDVQGEGIVDTTTHLVDMIHWMLFPGQAIEYDNDIQLTGARRWPTKIPRDIFSRITGSREFPGFVKPYVKDDVLEYFCNGDFTYRVRGIPVEINNIWNLEIPPGGGDTHFCIVKGTRSDLLVRQLAERGFKTELLIVPRCATDEIIGAVEGCLDRWADVCPGLSLVAENDTLLIQIPDRLRTTHEKHFCKVRDAFLGHLDRGDAPAETRANMLAKYTLLAEARELALSKFGLEE